jgi:hypothetical protein
MQGNLTQQTMELLKKLQNDPVLEKANTTTGISAGFGVVNYNLEPYAKTLYPVITPIRNKTPRFTDNNGGNAVHWKIITAINPSRQFPGTTEGIRGSVIDQTEDDRLASFVRFSLENSLTEEAIMQAEGFDNALAIMADNLLRSLFIAEEEWMLVGNATGLQQPSAPTGTPTTGGSMAASSSNYCKVVALTYDGWKRATVSGGVVTQFLKSSPLGESMTINGGASKVSAASAAATTTSTNNAVTWFVTAVPGAFAYAWFTGTSSSAGGCTLTAITNNNTFTQTAAATGTQVDNGNGGQNSLTANLGTGNNYSANGSVFDGLISQAVNPLILSPSGSQTATGQYLSLDGGTLTGNSDGSITQIDTILQAFYNNYKLTPTKMWVSAKQAQEITLLTLQSGSNGVFRITLSNEPGAQGGVTAGSMVSAYLNKYAVGGPKALPIEIHPNLPAGKIFFDCDEIPYPLANIPGCYRMHCLRDYYQRVWPQTTETRFTSVNFYGTLQCYVPFAMGLLDNIN